MFNPFTEVAEGGPTDAELAEKAKSGDRAALEKLVLRHQAWIYNIAVRMVFQPQVRRPQLTPLLPCVSGWIAWVWDLY